jgi:SAM-dependent methyltransferase
VPEDLNGALASLRPLLLDLDTLVRAVAAGRRRGTRPAYQRVEFRPVDIKAGRRLQVVLTDRSPLTHNVTGDDAERLVDDMLAEPFGNWYVETDDEIRQLRVTKKGQAQVHVARTSSRDVAVRSRAAAHDRAKHRLLDPGDPLFDLLGADADKRRQVDAFLRLLAPVVDRAIVRAVRADRSLHVVDLGCGNAYLTFAAHRYLAGRAGTAGVATVGVDVRPDMVARNTELAARGPLPGLRFLAGTIGETDPELGDVDVVLALHACDTATDDALAAAVRWRAPVVLAAPCCHHDLQRQLAERQAAGQGPPSPYRAITRHGILRERFADVLTDALRASLLRCAGYRVDVVEFVDSRHTPRNAMIRAELTGAGRQAAHRAEYDGLVTAWGVRPRLAELLGNEVGLTAG